MNILKRQKINYPQKTQRAKLKIIHNGRIFERMHSSYSDCQWTIRECRGDNAEPLVAHVVLAEFDIDTGSTVRYQYPVPIPGYKEDWFAEHMLPEGAHNNHWINPTSSTPSEGNLLYGINLVRNKADSTVRRGAVVKALAIFSRYHFLEVFRAPLVTTLDEYYSNPSVGVLEELFNALNSVSLAECPRPNIVEQRVMHLGVSASYPSSTVRATPTATSGSNAVSTGADYLLVDFTPTRWYFRTSTPLFHTPSMPLHISLHGCPDDLGAANLSYLVRVFQQSGVMKIYNAILTRKRVLFVGYDHAAGDVCQMVLSAVAMVAPPLCGVIRRAFPYVNLTDLSFLEVEGYIAGATNPMFQQHNTWWDLLCVLDLPNKRGTVQTAEEHRIEEAAQKGKPYTPVPPRPEDILHEPSDAKFFSFVLSGLDARLGEEWVKSQFYEHTSDILLQGWDIEHIKAMRGESPPLVPLSSAASAVGGARSTVLLNRVSSVGTPVGSSSSSSVSASAAAANAPPSAPGTASADKRRKRADANRFRTSCVRKSPEFMALPSNPWAWCHSRLHTASEQKRSDERTLAHKGSDVDGWDNGDVGAELLGGTLLAQVRRLQQDKEMDSLEVEAAFSILENGLKYEESLQALLTLLLPESTSGGLSVIAVGLLHPNKRVKKHAAALLRRIESYPSTAAPFRTLNKFFKGALDKLDGGEIGDSTPA